MIDIDLLKEVFITVDGRGDPHADSELTVMDKSQARMVIQVVYCPRSGETMTKVLKNSQGAKG